MSKAKDILDGVVFVLQPTKDGIIRTVDSEYASLHELIREARNSPEHFPKAVISFGEQEKPAPSSLQVVGEVDRFLLPIVVDIYVIRLKGRLLTDTDNALAEVRNTIEATPRWTDNNYPTQFPLKSVKRVVTPDATRVTNPYITFGAASVNFDVLYWYERGRV